MQSLYGWEIVKTSNYWATRDKLISLFTPDWNEEEKAQSEEFQEEKKRSLAWFDTHVDPSHPLPQASADLHPNNQEVLLYYHNQMTRDTNLIFKSLQQQAEKIYNNYLRVIQLLIDLGDMAKPESISPGEQKTVPVSLSAPLLQENQAYQKLKGNLILRGELLKRGINWNERRDIVRSIYKNLVQKDPVFLEYAQDPARDLEKDIQLLNHIVKKIIFRRISVNRFEISEFIFSKESIHQVLGQVDESQFVESFTKAIQAAIDKFFQHFYEDETASPQNLAQQIQKKITQGLTEFYRDISASRSDFQATLLSLLEKKTVQEAESQEEMLSGELLIRQGLEQVVIGISDWLDEKQLNEQDNQTRIVASFNWATQSYLEALNLPWEEQDRMHLNIKGERKNSLLTEYFGEQDLFWTENQKIVQSMVQSTVKSILESPEEDFKPALLSKNWEEDKIFFTDLFKKSIEEDERYESIIASKSRNWEINRLALIDKIILKMAICEMIHFYSIPVKVSINEYIELSKLYSTPKSRQFVNGLLDAISQDLLRKKIIKKSGRGLLDNR